jgi:hypothetical protein
LQSWPFDQHLAGGRRFQPGDALQQRALAGAVGPDQRHHLAGLDVQADALDGLDGAVGDAQVAHVEHAHGATDKDSTVPR